ncbi:MAG: hypothetical protein E7C49_19330 [Clostridium sp.]|nr:hypothetical protein [Clostridium sp.]
MKLSQYILVLEKNKIDKKKHKLFEGYEEALIFKEEFKERKEELKLN